MPTAQEQAEALLNPPPITANTQTNPDQQGAVNAATEYERGLASGTNAEIERELGRARDQISVGMQAEGEGAMGRGADPTLFRTRALAAGKRDLHALQGRLADVALGRRAEAIGLRTGAASAAAGETRLMHLGTLAQRLAEQRANVERAEVQARLNQAPYDRMISMMSSVGANRVGGVLGSSGGSGGAGFLAGAGSGGMVKPRGAVGATVPGTYNAINKSKSAWKGW